MKQRRTTQLSSETVKISFKSRRRIPVALQTGKYRMHLCVRPVFPSFADAMNCSNEAE